MTDLREDVLKVLKARHSDTFTGCVHAEATLMGLVNYYGHESMYASQGAPVENAWRMRKFIQPVLLRFSIFKFNFLTYLTGGRRRERGDCC